MAEPTKGPWHWWDRNDKPNPRPKDYDLAHLAGNNRIILSMYGGEGDNALGKTPEDKANARLLAGAWEMKDEIKASVELFTKTQTTIRQLMPQEWLQAFDRRQDGFKAILKKIEGDL